MAFKRQEREAAASIMAGDRYCPDPELHELVARAASQERPQPHMHPNYDCGGKGHGSDASEVQWCHNCTPHATRCNVCGGLADLAPGQCIRHPESSVASQERPSIDVERLATAIWFDGIHKGKPFSVEASRWYAESLSAEYARLSGPEGE